jgi:hypothetical protein
VSAFDIDELPPHVVGAIQELATRRGLTLSEATERVVEEGLAMRLADIVKQQERKAPVLSIVGRKRPSKEPS